MVDSITWVNHVGLTSTNSPVAEVDVELLSRNSPLMPDIHLGLIHVIPIEIQLFKLCAIIYQRYIALYSRVLPCKSISSFCLCVEVYLNLDCIVVPESIGHIHLAEAICVGLAECHASVIKDCWQERMLIEV